MNDQEIDRNMNCQAVKGLKTMVRRRIDQVIRTRNFKAWNERIETGIFGSQEPQMKNSQR